MYSRVEIIMFAITSTINQSTVIMKIACYILSYKSYIRYTPTLYKMLNYVIRLIPDTRGVDQCQRQGVTGVGVGMVTAVNRTVRPTAILQ